MNVKCTQVSCTQLYSTYCYIYQIAITKRVGVSILQTKYLTIAPSGYLCHCPSLLSGYENIQTIVITLYSLSRIMQSYKNNKSGRVLFRQIRIAQFFIFSFCSKHTKKRGRREENFLLILKKYCKKLFKYLLKFWGRCIAFKSQKFGLKLAEFS